MTQQIDLIGIGNGMLDRYFYISDTALGEMGCEKGSAGLIDDADVEGFVNQIPNQTAPGGSISNSVAVASYLGAKAQFITALGNDDIAETYMTNLDGEGVVFKSPLTRDKTSAFCNVYVTPDGERTMRTYLGAAATLDENHLILDHLPGVKIAFLEGYVMANPNGFQTLMKMAEMLKQHDIKIAFSGSATFVMQYFNDNVKNFMKDYVDIFFSNQDEAHTLLGHDDLTKMSELVPHNVITKGPQGVYTCIDGVSQSFPIVGNNISVVDTTGAGDAFAGGYLYGLLTGETLERCVHVGQKAACYIIQRFGARPDSQVRASID